jgi:two-component system CitB family sensor kinase
VATLPDGTDIQELTGELATMTTLWDAPRAQSHGHAKRLPTVSILIELTVTATGELPPGRLDAATSSPAPATSSTTPSTRPRTPTRNTCGPTSSPLTGELIVTIADSGDGAAAEGIGALFHPRRLGQTPQRGSGRQRGFGLVLVRQAAISNISSRRSRPSNSPATGLQADRSMNNGGVSK